MRFGKRARADLRLQGCDWKQNDEDQRKQIADRDRGDLRVKPLVVRSGVQIRSLVLSALLILQCNRIAELAFTQTNVHLAPLQPDCTHRLEMAGMTKPPYFVGTL